MLRLACVESVLASNPPQSISTPAGLSGNATPPSSSANVNTKSKTTNLGKINVTAMRELIKTLQVVKVALKTPFSDHAADADQVVCRLNTSGGYGYLDCGTQGWYTMRRDSFGTVLLNGTMIPQPTRGHPWHSVCQLNLRQLMNLRALLKKLPAPGKGGVVVVDKNGKAVMTVKESAGSDGSGKN
ncbi:MAG: hypothetical protein ACYDCJ_08175 [Gammaproteobacteria bacterium]